MSYDCPEQKLKLYTDKKYLPSGSNHVVLLYPFWGKNSGNPNDPDRGRFDIYANKGTDFFELTSKDEADAAILPFEWIPENLEAQQRARQMLEDIGQHGLNLAVFYNNDSAEKVPLNGSVIFRTSLYKSARDANEFAVPGWSEDFLKSYLDLQLPIRKKTPKPTISFCGFALPYPTHSSYIRFLAIDILLQNQSYVDTNFIIRDQFWGGALESSEKIIQARREYVANMVGSDYVLCARGAGNFSYRLYEALSCGRIPVFINTDCVLPYEDFLDWKRYCVWVETKDLELIAEKVFDFHRSLSPSEFAELQYACRKLWEDWISPQGFFANFYRFFQA